MKFKFLYLVMVISIVIVGCGGEQTNKLEQIDKTSIFENTKLVSNGKHKLTRATSGQMNVYSFNLNESGFLTLEADYSKCDTKLLDNRGKIVKTINYSNYINEEVEKGKYYVKIESKSNQQCTTFDLFSPKIDDDFTNKNNIANGTYTISTNLMNTYNFNMSENGFVTLEADYSKCDVKLLDNKGKIIKTVDYTHLINKEVSQGKYYIKIESKSNQQCITFDLFSPKINGDFTNGSLKEISNGSQGL